MTGEMFALLATQSVLRVTEAVARPAEAVAALFSVRAGLLLGQTTPAQAGGRLSGLLIGMELAAAVALFPGGGVALIGDGALSARYARALGVVGRPARIVDPAAATLAGLTAAHAHLFGDAR